MERILNEGDVATVRLKSGQTTTLLIVAANDTSVTTLDEVGHIDHHNAFALFSKCVYVQDACVAPRERVVFGGANYD